MINFHIIFVNDIIIFKKRIMSGFYEELCNLFIRPARQTYSEYDLGPLAIGHYGIRQNFSFTSSKNHQIKTSFFKNKNNQTNTCILYLHSFNGSRLQSLRYSQDVLQRGFHFCSFDFAGCGNSGGEYVSLGCNQRWDILQLIQILQKKYEIYQFFIWGRSMGAVAAIKFYSLLSQQQKLGRNNDCKIIGLILDSAFISLKRMVVEVGRNRINVPEILIKAIFLMVGSSIEQRAQFKIQQLDLEKDIETIRCSTMLIASKQDNFISYSHSQQIFSNLKLHDNKEIAYIRGEHFENRDQNTINLVYQFFEKKYKKYCELQQRFNILKTSQLGKNIQDISVQKNSKSLRKYEPRTLIQSNQYIRVKQNIDKKVQSSTKIVLFRNENNDIKCQDKSSSYKTIGSDKKMLIEQAPIFERQYQTQKRIDHGQQNVKILLSSGKDTRLKNQLRSKSKPYFYGKITDFSSREKRQKQQQMNNLDDKFIEKDENQEDHRNVIADKLRKKGKNQREKEVQFKETIREDMANHINKIKFENNKTNTSLNFAGPLTPTYATQHTEQNRLTKKLSMTAQQYKNNQIKIIKGAVNLSPHIKRRGEKMPITEEKVKTNTLIDSQQRCYEQTKSMTCLIPLNMLSKREQQSLSKMGQVYNISINQYSKG